MVERRPVKPVVSGSTPDVRAMKSNYDYDLEDAIKVGFLCLVVVIAAGIIFHSAYENNKTALTIQNKERARCAEVCDGRKVATCARSQHPVRDQKLLLAVCVDERSADYHKLFVMENE